MPTATLRITGHALPGRRWSKHSNVHVGIQHRKDVINVVPGDAERAVFELPIDIVLDPATGNDYRGPFAQGKRGQRFIYLSWGVPTGGTGFAMFSRIKINLFNVPEHVARALAEGGTVNAELDLTDSRGTPVCASIPPQDIRWTIDDAGS